MSENPLPPFCLRRGKTSTLSIQQCCFPNAKLFMRHKTRVAIRFRDKRKPTQTTRNFALVCLWCARTVQKKTTISTRLHAKRYKFETNRRFHSKLPSPSLQVTRAPASCSLAPQNPSQLQDNRSLINNIWSLGSAMNSKQAGLLRDVNISSLATWHMGDFVHVIDTHSQSCYIESLQYLKYAYFIGISITRSHRSNCKSDRYVVVLIWICETSV